MPDALDPDRRGCLFLDVRSAGMSGLEPQQRLPQLPIGPPPILVAGQGDVPVAVRAA